MATSTAADSYDLNQYFVHTAGPGLEKITAYDEEIEELRRQVQISKELNLALFESNKILKFTTAEKLLKDTMFACALLQAALNAVSETLVKIPKRSKYRNLTVCIKQYKLKEKVEKAQSDLKTLKIAENENRILSLIADQQQVVDILNEFILRYAMTEFLERPIFTDVCYHYYDAHVSENSTASVLVEHMLEEQLGFHT